MHTELLPTVFVASGWRPWGRDAWQIPRTEAADRVGETPVRSHAVAGLMSQGGACECLGVPGGGADDELGSPLEG